jgi:hypothetical protein
MGMATIPWGPSKEVLEQFAMQESLKDVPAFILNCPVQYGWARYKNEEYFAMLNYEQSVKSGRPMIDLAYCATEGMNGNVLKTVMYVKKKFKKSKLQ